MEAQKPKKEPLTIRVPISAHMRVIDGKAEMVDAEYADVPVEVVVELLVKSFGLPAKDA